MDSKDLDFDAYYSHPQFKGVALRLTGYVQAVMVGDGFRYTVDVSDLTKISEDDFCDGCGQIGCGHSSKREK